MRWTDDFARRDAIDLARTLLDRLVETKRRHLVWSLRAWRDGTLGEPARLAASLDDFAFSVSAMTRLLALHEDYSLADSLDRLNAVHPVANPNFEHVLVDNAVNGYCRSHQYEAAAFWYEPLARDCVVAARAKVAADDRTPIDDAALAAKSEAYHQAMLTRPLVEMRPTAPRTEAAFRALMRELAARLRSLDRLLSLDTDTKGMPAARLLSLDTEARRDGEDSRREISSTNSPCSPISVFSAAGQASVSSAAGPASESGAAGEHDKNGKEAK